MAGRILFEGLAPQSQDAKAVEAWARVMNMPNTRADIIRLTEGKALVRSRDGSKYYFTTATTCTCPAGQFGKECRHKKMVRAAFTEPKPAERRSFKPDGWD